MDYCFRNKMLGKEALRVQDSNMSFLAWHCLKLLVFGKKPNQQTNKYSATSKILVTIHGVQRIRDT